MTPDQMPLYPDEVTIAIAVLGAKRAKDWPSIAKFLTDKRKGCRAWIPLWAVAIGRS